MSGPIADEAIWLRVDELSDVASVRRKVTAFAHRLGFGADRSAQVALVAAEAASNLYKHAVDGRMAVRASRVGALPAIDLVCVDEGPGIADVSRVVADGFSTSGTLGVGLGAIVRLADDCDLYSIPARGTVLAVRLCAEPDRPTAPVFAGLTQPYTDEEACGDAYTVAIHEGVAYAMMCDGLGHGPLAAMAAQEAVRAVPERMLPAGAAELLEHVHRRLSPTRGGAVAVAVVDYGRGQVRFAGLGNIGAWIVDGERRQGMVSAPGIAGHQARRIREFGYPLHRGACVVLHSDGLSGRWAPADFPGLFGHRPMAVAATLLRDTGVRRDDRGVLVLRAA